MAWSDKPTENQICFLARHYDAILYDRIGRVRDELSDNLTKDAARLIKTRREISDEIDITARKGVVKHREAREFLEKELAKNNITIKLEVKNGSQN